MICLYLKHFTPALTVHPQNFSIASNSVPFLRTSLVLDHLKPGVHILQDVDHEKHTKLRRFWICTRHNGNGENSRHTKCKSWSRQYQYEEKKSKAKLQIMNCYKVPWRLPHTYNLLSFHVKKFVLKCVPWVIDFGIVRKNCGCVPERMEVLVETSVTMAMIPQLVGWEKGVLMKGGRGLLGIEGVGSRQLLPSS